MPGFVLDFCRKLGRRGYEMHALVPHYKGARRRETLEKVPVHRFRYWTASGETLTYEGTATSKIKKTPVYGLKLLFYVATMWLQTIRLTRRHKIAVVNAHWLVPQGFIAVMARFITRTPVVVSVHGGDVFGLKGGFMTACKRWTLKRADTVVVNSSATLDAVQVIYDKREHRVIPMGIDIERFDATKKHRPKSQPFTILFAGRISKEKGLPYLCEAAKTLKEQGYGFRVLIAGSGPEESQIKQYITTHQLENNIELLGWVAHEKLADYYAEADVFVGPSLVLDSGWQEAFGLVFAESLASGTPVIATETGGIRDVVLHEKNGFLVPQKDAQAIAEKLALLINNPELLKKMSTQSRAHIAENFSWEAVTKKYAAVLERVAKPDAGQSKSHAKLKETK